MKPMTIPLSCGLAVTAMLAAGISHWWSVRQFTSMLEHGLTIEPVATPTSPATVVPSLAQAAPQEATAPAAVTAFNQADDARQKQFYEALIEKLARVENQNRDLLDQLAETNRDLMKLEFRVDTHSESFRPLPVVEEQPFSSIDTSGGVLPPRARPVNLPSQE